MGAAGGRGYTTRPPGGATGSQSRSVRQLTCSVLTLVVVHILAQSADPPSTLVPSRKNTHKVTQLARQR